MNDSFNLFRVFATGKEPLMIDSLKKGHIHNTFVVRCTDNSRFILQNINTNVFTDVAALQDNLARITQHIRSKINSDSGGTGFKTTLDLVHTIDGESWHQTQGGEGWRLFRYIEDHLTYERIESEKVAAEAGAAIGNFQVMLSDLPDPKLHETIPDFHNLTSRFMKLQVSVNLNKAGRLKTILPVVREMEKDYKEMVRFMDLIEKGYLPERIAHNDTKVNNILFDYRGKAMCVIDLDTVMPGTIHFDFGDAIRTGANSGDEDDKNLRNVFLKLGVFRAYTRGYLSETSDMLNATEKKQLAFGAIAITWEQAIRFLTDYIDGDTYYKVDDPQHNLRRTLAQRQLLRSLKDNYDTMDNIVASYS